MPNRAQRREMMRKQIGKSKALVASYTKQQRIAELIKNGITPHDLQQEHEKGRSQGFKEAAMPIIKCCHAGIILVLHDNFGFTDEQCFEAVSAVDNKIIWALNHLELAEEVLDKTGIEIVDDAFDRVQRKSPSASDETSLSPSVTSPLSGETEGENLSASAEASPLSGETKKKVI